jgi:hypothetical protein
MLENISNAIEQREVLEELGFKLVLEIPKDCNWIWKNYD